MGGKFIAIEGADGTGKKTQTDRLASRLKEAGVRVKLFDFPRYDEGHFGKMVGRFLNGDFGSLEEVSPYLASLPFAGDRWQAGPQIRKAKKEGYVVLSNRYFLSNIAHQAAKLEPELRDEFIDFLEELEYEVYGIPREDLNIVLHINPELSRKLIEQKSKRSYLEGKKKDIHEEALDYQVTVSKIYRELPERYKHVVGIDCVKEGKLMSIEEIHEIVWSEVGSHLKEILREGRISRERQS